MPDRSRIFALTPRTIAAIYAIFSFLWIIGSDRVVLFLFSSETLITTIQTIKGGLFVGISGVLIWYLMRRRETQIRESHERLEAATQRLGVLQRVFRHNIRNDMNVVKGYIDLASERARSTEVSRALETASRTAGDVIGIGEKLGILDQYGFRPPPDETVDLVAVTSDAVERFADTHPEATVSLETPDDSHVVGDGAIAHVIDELLENAAEHYDGPIETLRVEVTVTETGSYGHVRVADNGPGIPAGELRALRAGHESHLIHLSSVGFWLVYWLCERLDATVEVETEHGSGTRVDLAFPKAGTEPSSVPADPVAQQPASGTNQPS